MVERYFSFLLIQNNLSVESFMLPWKYQYGIHAHISRYVCRHLFFFFKLSRIGLQQTKLKSK